ncbi:MAG TPA: winged helix DNA-binding protein, partial [Sphingomonadales bacterium]|nr:winged helix DNA-binding protein [Sphingomonadales bacterium]
PTISRLVKDMVRLGLVMREAGETDARASVISITPKGNSLFERGRTARLMALTTALSKLSDDKLDLLETAARLMEGAAKGLREG